MSTQVLNLRLPGTSTSVPTYGPISCSGQFDAGEDGGQQPWSGTGTFSNLKIILDTVPGSGASWTFAVRVNGVTSSLSATASDSTAAAADTSNSASVSAGDRVTIIATPSGTPAACAVIWFSVDFTPSTANLSGYGGRTNLTIADGTTVYFPLLNPPSSVSGSWATAGNATEIIPCDGTLTRLDLRLGSNSNGMAAGLSYDATIYLNGVKQDGTGGTVNTTCTLAGSGTGAGAPLAASSTFSLPVVEGDEVVLEIIDTNATIKVGYSCAFVASGSGQSIYAGGGRGTPSTSATNFNLPAFGEETVTWSSAENTGIRLRVGVTPFSLSKMHVRTTAAPTAGKSYTLSLRRNAATPSGAPSVTISDAETSDVDSTNGLALLSDDQYDIQAVPSGTPTTGIYRWTMVQGVSSPITGSLVAGVDTTVSATRAIAFGLDGNTNVHSTAGQFKVFGDMAVTGTTTLNDLTVTGTTALANNSISYAEMQDISAASRLLGRGSAAGAGDPQEISIGAGLTMSGTTLQLTAAGSGLQRVIGITIDGGGSVISTGVKGFASAQFSGTITKWRLLSTDASSTVGSIVIDVWKDTYANYPPTVADTITASAKPTLSSVNKNEDSILTGWSTSVTDGDVFGFKVDSATTVTRVTLEITVTL
jgi:hypothetical protein